MRSAGDRAGLTRAIVVKEIKTLTKKKGYPPTFRELADSLGVAFATVNYWLNLLKKEKAVTWQTYAPRTLQVKKGV